MQDILPKINNKNSHKLYKRACEIIPGGVNSPVRSFKAVNLEPLFISKAEGQYIWDVDQNQYIDYVNSWGALIHGHSHPEVISEIIKVLPKGTSYGTPHEKEIELVEIIINHFPSIEKIRLVNSGTEAVMTAIRLARAYTNKNKIIKFSGCYHGHSDSLLSNSGSGILTFDLPSSPGVTKNTASETITLPYNNTETLEKTLIRHKNEIACVILEPVVGNCGVILPHDEFLKSVRSITAKHNCLLIFDEVITGFRLSFGGAQQKYNINPDLTTLGKIIGGGMPIGAVGGKSKIMDLLAPCGPVYQAGTLSGNPISVACGIATLKLINESTYDYLEKITSILCDELKNISSENKINLQINRAGSMFTLFFTDDCVFDLDSAKKSDIEIYSSFFKHMLENGIYFAPSQFEANFLSTAHTDKNVKKTLEIFKRFTSAFKNSFSYQ